MELAQLRAFVAVADAGGFTAAAGAMGMTQPGVSRAVAALERDSASGWSCVTGRGSG
jgi:DNA-binding transcriptional LysR family regulator